MPAFVQSEQEFNSKLKNELVIVDFTASWCGPCRTMSPVFEELSFNYPAVSFLKVDVDQLQSVAASQGVSAMPTFIAYVNGVKYKDVVGASKPKLEELVQELSKLKKYTEQELMGMSVKDLKNVMRSRMIKSMAGVVEKADMVKLIIETYK